LLAAPVTVLLPSGPGHAGEADDWPGVGLLDPDLMVALLDRGDLAALSAVLAALRAVGGWAEVSVALSRAFRPGPSAELLDGEAFVTVVARALPGRGGVDPRVRAAAEQAGCTVAVELPGSCVIEGRLAARGAARLGS